MYVWLDLDQDFSSVLYCNHTSTVHDKSMILVYIGIIIKIVMINTRINTIIEAVLLL
jgi:hypothetical protein